MKNIWTGGQREFVRMMAPGWALWAGMAALLAAAPPPGARSFTHVGGNLCRWCDASSPTCRDNVCFTNCTLSSFCTLAEEICIAIWRKTNDTATVHTLCHNPALPLEGVSPALLLSFTSRECHMTSQPAEDATVMVCGCQGEHECNDKLIFDQGAHGFSRLQTKDVVPVVVVSLVPPLLVVVAATLTFYLYRSRQVDKPHPPARPDWPPKQSADLYLAPDPPCGEGGCVGVTGPGLEQGAPKHPTSDVIHNGTDCPGQVTELLPIKLEVLVGKGRFAEVWMGRLLQAEKGGGTCPEPVAVKVFPALEYASWRNECSIFSDPKMEHGNIVRFHAAEERGPPGHALRQYWLVLAYHSLGNLQDFLTANVLSWEELVAMAASVAKGLAHLHSDTTPGGLPKVPVAHRDLKSSNIVMKSRTECALCDFGLALRLDLSLTVDDYANSGQVGTARYMAPEVLESRVNLEDLEAFKQMDVYSMALVLWEMASRCHANGEVKRYQPAFGSQVCEQPCVDSMRDLVLRDRGRPDIPAPWSRHKGLSIFCSTMVECWDHDPEARLTAHCVVERFQALQDDPEELGNQADTHGGKDPEAPEEDREAGQPQTQVVGSEQL